MDLSIAFCFHIVGGVRDSRGGALDRLSDCLRSAVGVRFMGCVCAGEELDMSWGSGIEY